MVESEQFLFALYSKIFAVLGLVPLGLGAVRKGSEKLACRTLP